MNKKTPPTPVSLKTGWHVHAPQCCCVSCEPVGESNGSQFFHGPITRAPHPFRAERGGRIVVYRRRGSAVARIQLAGPAAEVWQSLESPSALEGVVRATGLSWTDARDTISELLTHGLLRVRAGRFGGSDA